MICRIFFSSSTFTFALILLLTFPHPTISTNQRGIDFLRNLLANDQKIQTTSSGLNYKVLNSPKTPYDVRLIEEYNKPTSNTVVNIHYKGKTIDNKVFDNTYKKNKPIRTYPKDLLPGINEAITSLMEVGTKLELYIPSNLGYGEVEGKHHVSGVNNGDVLIFTVELLEIEWDGKVSLLNWFLGGVRGSHPGHSFAAVL